VLDLVVDQDARYARNRKLRIRGFVQ